MAKLSIVTSNLAPTLRDDKHKKLASEVGYLYSPRGQEFGKSGTYVSVYLPTPA